MGGWNHIYKKIRLCKQHSRLCQQIKGARWKLWSWQECCTNLVHLSVLVVCNKCSLLALCPTTYILDGAMLPSLERSLLSIFCQPSGPVDMKCMSQGNFHKILETFDFVAVLGYELQWSLILLLFLGTACSRLCSFFFCEGFSAFSLSLSQYHELDGWMTAEWWLCDW